MFISNKGRLIVTLCSLYNIVDGKGASYNQGELLRWLGESVMYPTNLLPSEKLQWIAINKFSAKIVFKYMDLSLFFIVSINDIGEITQLETNRYMDEQHLEKWIIKIGNYNIKNNMLIPTNFEVLWLLQKGDFRYAKFNIKKIEYDVPRVFE